MFIDFDFQENFRAVLIATIGDAILGGFFTFVAFNINDGLGKIVAFFAVIFTLFCFFRYY
jgi:hypothetical protein